MNRLGPLKEAVRSPPVMLGQLTGGVLGSATSVYVARAGNRVNL